MSVSPLQVWLRVQAVLWLACCVALPWIVHQPWWGTAWAAVMGVSYFGVVSILRAGRSAADLVTLARFVLLMLLVVEGDTGFGIELWIVAVFAALLDLADGAVARRFGGSPEGAVLDMETDQFAVITFASLVVCHGGAVHVLVLPALRYVFVLAMWCVGAPAHDPRPTGDNRRGRRVCAAVVVALLVALVPGLPAFVRDGATLVAVLLLGWSFAADAKFLVARVRRARAFE